MAPSDDDRSREHSGERGSGGNTSRDDNDELATKSLRIQSKRYYVDVKQNNRGRFIKLVEGLPNGNKNRISFPMSTITEVIDKLSAFSDFYNDMDPKDDKESSDDGRDGGRQDLKSDDVRAGQRRIYFDLRENKRGVYLRIRSTAQYGSPRNIIALPAEGITEIRDALKEFYDEFGGSEEDVPEELPEFQEMRVERKRFYFDCGSNDRGSFLRISEVTNRYRSSITLPKQGLHKFRDIIDDMIHKMDG